MTPHLLSPRRIRRALAAPTLALALLGLTACGEVGGTVAKTSSSSASPSSLAGGQQISAADFADLVRNAFDDATTAHISLTVAGSAGMSAEGQVDYRSNPLKAQLTMDASQLGGESEVRLVDDVIYLKLPMFGDKFVRADIDDPDNPVGQMFLRQFDVSAIFDGFETGIEKATYVGSETVDGAALDHYQVVVDPALLLDVPASEQLKEVRTLDFDIWFDSEGLVRRMTFDAPPPLGTLEIVLSGWGDEVSIEAPPADQVTSLPGI